VQKKRVSIKDIAEATGVSHPTVSRALRSEGRMSDQTRTRILDAARTMGYTPSLVARGLVMQRTNTIGLVVTNFADPFHSEVARGVEDEAVLHQFSVYIASSKVDAKRELEVVRAFQGRQVDGIIVSSSRVGDQYADLLQETGVPIVLVNNHADGTNIYAVYHDDYTGAYTVAQHLIDCGYRRIAYLGNGRAGRANTERKRGWGDILRRAGLPAEVKVLGSNGRLQGGGAGVAPLLDEAKRLWNAWPDAIMCYNDTMAIGVLRELHGRGIQVPEDIALTGYDDIEISGYVQPPLTTWHQPRYELGREAMRMVLALLNSTDPDEVPNVVLLTGQLVVRASTIKKVSHS